MNRQIDRIDKQNNMENTDINHEQIDGQIEQINRIIWKIPNKS